MKMTQLLVLFLVVSVQVAAGFPTGGRESKHASWDDVNVVAHGLLQLGQGLKEHVDKSKAQMRDVSAKMKELNSTVSGLEKKQTEQDEALKTEVKEAEERERMVAQLAEEMRLKVEEMKKQDQDVHTRMDRLEEKVDEVLSKPTLDSNYSDDAGVPFIQRLMAVQNRRIDQLVEKIKQQQDKLEKQSVHLQALQSKVAQKRLKSHRRRHDEEALRVDAEQSGFAKDCHDLFVKGQRTSGVYTIQPENSKPFSVLCEMTSEGGWTVIQKRHDGSQSFNQLWDGYKRGFGRLTGDFWLGLDNIHSVSRQGQYVLQVELSDWSTQEQVFRYQFQVDGEEQQYALHLQPQDSSEGLVTTGASGLPFSTADRDNDLDKDVNCAEMFSGGWWFSGCGNSNLNGKYPRMQSVTHQPTRQSMFWTTTNGHNTALKTTLLKIKPVTIKP
ncbi:angiopoietin-related protein 4-like [Sphaeramia orbicularis]|uniref:Angiopoietin-related protein 4-like n=1 Tax=Sphaeramia orbicularis TaxID=375764 RepID=A0A673C7N6_9TELE|nr:angiopoietin-related protein 4-like [Sphaeramia orbicularis]